MEPRVVALDGRKEKFSGLEAFVTSRSARSNPGESWCCRLPDNVRAEIEEAVGKGLRNWKAISDWLLAEGYTDSTPARVMYHFDRRHPQVTR